ncbi:hypothetical protein VTK73DRAFT_1485 [Phialemonium thermophilum]|uniref:Transcription factor domain-containing protein n=1 Tax=Phialemonium thermophilum TaxID=223376 RepID=A0ABR3VTD6_9PEZI
MIHPQWSILDPSLHTPSLVRSRSALLMSTILALGSSALATLPDSSDDTVSEALRLHAHVEKLNLVVYATGARSVDIIQAQILLCRWGASAKTRLDEHRWVRCAMFPRMAGEIGLTLPRRYDGHSGLDPEQAEKFRWNDIRTRAFMVINEYRFFTYSGRRPMDLSDLELDDEAIEKVTRLSRERSAVSLAAYYHLYLFDKSVRQRLDQYEPRLRTGLSLDAELEHIKAYIERWIRDWCPEDGDRRLNWHLTHEALSCWLLLAVNIAKRRPPQHAADQARQQQLLLDLSIRMFKLALRVPEAIRTTHRSSIFPFAASIILRLSARRDLVLRVALRMTGDPERPFVPSFVRDSGNQILVMLCTNDIRPPLSTAPVDIPQAGSRDSQKAGAASTESETTQPPGHPDDPEAAAAAEDTSPTPHHHHRHGGSEEVAAEQDASNGNLPYDGSQLGPDLSVDNIFAFNGAYFPYVPDPTQPQVPSQDSMLPHCLSADLDALLGASVLYPSAGFDVSMGSEVTPGFSRGDDAEQGSSHLHEFAATQGSNALGGGAAAQYDTTFGFQVDAMSTTQSSLPQPPGNSPWSSEAYSPGDTALRVYRSGTNRDSQSAEREVLLATADRLIQLASRMQ